MPSLKETGKSALTILPPVTSPLKALDFSGVILICFWGCCNVDGVGEILVGLDKFPVGLDIFPVGLRGCKM